MTWIEETGGEPERVFLLGDRVVVLNAASGEPREAGTICEVYARSADPSHISYRVEFDSGKKSMVRYSHRVLTPA